MSRFEDLAERYAANMSELEQQFLTVVQEVLKHEKIEIGAIKEKFRSLVYGICVFEGDRINALPSEELVKQYIREILQDRAKLVEMIETIFNVYGFSKERVDDDLFVNLTHQLVSPYGIGPYADEGNEAPEFSIEDTISQLRASLKKDLPYEVTVVIAQYIEILEAKLESNPEN